MAMRLIPERPFPPYAFVPGRFPHPVSNPAGHSFGAKPDIPAPLELSRWTDNTTYRYGIDLFNAQFYWESHVEFESLWLACGRTGDLANFLKGLIKLAAAGVKHLQGVPAGVTSHACRAAELWRGVAAGRELADDDFLGLSLGDLIHLASSIGADGWPRVPPEIVPRQMSKGPAKG